MSEFSSPPKTETQVQNPLTLSMLFYLVTVAAILAACLRFVGASQATLGQYLWASLLGAVVGFFLGTSLGLGTSVRLLAPAVGIFLGAVIGPLICIELSHFASIIITSFVGAWIIVLLNCLAVRHASTRSIG
jgi:hypothetical protein